MEMAIRNWKVTARGFSSYISIISSSGSWSSCILTNIYEFPIWVQVSSVLFVYEYAHAWWPSNSESMSAASTAIAYTHRVLQATWYLLLFNHLVESQLDGSRILILILIWVIISFYLRGAFRPLHRPSPSLRPAAAPPPSVGCASPRARRKRLHR